ncbi:MAG TPA: ABC transporter ATP-binding protein [Burkholderiales bacterium]
MHRAENPAMLRAENLRIAFPGRTLVDGLSVDFGAGQVWAILGRNGSGKSTLLRTLAGLQPSQTKNVLLDGAPLHSISRRQAAARIGVLLQEESAEFWGTARDYVLLGRHPHAAGVFGWSRIDEDIAETELAAQNLGAFSGRAYTTLSGGERQRARAAALFAQRPRAYLVDEPLQHLDLPHQVALLERLSLEARQGALVVMVLHDLLFASRYCSHFLLLYGDGRFNAGSRDQALNAATLSDVYGFPLEAIEVRGEQLFLPGPPSARGPHV